MNKWTSGINENYIILLTAWILGTGFLVIFHAVLGYEIVHSFAMAIPIVLLLTSTLIDATRG